MLELFAYTALLLVLMPAFLFGIGKLILSLNNKLSMTDRGVHEVAAPAPKYEALHERLTAAAAANPLLPRWKRRTN